MNNTEQFFYNPIDDFNTELNKTTAIVFLPLYGLILEDKISLNEFILYPRFRVDFNLFNIDSLLTTKFETREEYLDSFREKEKEIFDTFSTHALLAFTIEIEDLDEYNNSDYEFEMYFLSILIEYADKLINLIKYYECGYNDYFKSITSAGYCSAGFSCSLIWLNHQKILKRHAGQLQNYAPTHDACLKLTQIDILKKNNIFNADIDEVGHLALNALKINSQIIDSSSNNTKFVLMMQLIDFLMLPNAYGNFKKIKGNFICQIAKNKQEYHDLSNWFKELTDGEGLRTQILHGGKNIDKILSQKDIQELFLKLQEYIKVNIDSMMFFYNKKWVDYEAHIANIKVSYQ